MSKTNNTNEENDNKRKTPTTRKTSRTSSRASSRTSSRKPKPPAAKKESAADKSPKEQVAADKKTVPKRTSTRRTPAKRKTTPAKAKPREMRLKLKDGETVSSLAKKIVAKRKSRQKEAAAKKTTARQTTKRTPTKRTTAKRGTTKRETTEREETSTAKRVVRNKTVTTDHQSNKDNSNHQSSKSTKNSSTASSNTTRNETTTFSVRVHQTVAVLIDGNNIEMSIHSMMHSKSAMLDFDKVIPKVLEDRGLNRLIYFREGLNISEKLAERLHKNYHGSVVPCHKSADIPLTITATQIAEKVDTIIIMSGDSDYVELVRHLKSRGVRVEIASVKATTAQILTDEADYSYEITKEDCFVFK